LKKLFFGFVLINYNKHQKVWAPFEGAPLGTFAEIIYLFRRKILLDNLIPAENFPLTIPS